MVLVIQSVLCADVMLKLEIQNTFSWVTIFILLKDWNLSIILTKLTFFKQLGTKEQVNTLLYGFPPSKSNTLNQDSIIIISFITKSGRSDKTLISFN